MLLHPADLPDTIPDAFAAIVRAASDRVMMQVKEGETYRRDTYQDTYARVQQLAAALLDGIVQPGERVAIVLENRPEWAVGYLSIVTAGATAVPLDIQMGEEGITSAIKESDSRAVFVSARTRELVRGIGGSSRIINVDEGEPRGDLTLRELLSRPPRSAGSRRGLEPDQVASLLYTSGTTKKPKGVLLTHRNLMANAKAILGMSLAGPPDNFLLILPLHHGYPFMIAFLVPLLLGARLTFLASLKGPDLIQCLRETGITVFVGVPQIFGMIRRGILDQVAQRPAPIRIVFRALLAVAGAVRARTGWNLGKIVFASLHRRLGGALRLLCSGGAKLDVAIATDLTRLGFTIREGYGLTETAPVVSFNPLHRPKWGSVGPPLPNVEVRIVDPDEQGVGQVAVRGPNVMRGYDRDPRSTEAVLRDGWFQTGDLGYLDRDGYLFLTGRLNDLIVTPGGKNIFPDELEREYQASPAISELCVLASDGSGEEGHLHAVVVPNTDYLKDHRIHDATNYIRDEITKVAIRLPPHKRILGVTLVKGPLPKTRLGKIKRHRVVELLRETQAPPQAPPTPSAEDLRVLQSEVGRRVTTSLRDILPTRKDVGLDDHLDFDLKLDSLKRVELLAALERHFGSLPETLVGEVTTVRELIERLEGLSRGEWTPAAEPQAWSDILRTPPPAELMASMLAELSSVDRVMTRLGWAALTGAFRLAFRLRGAGSDRLPAQGPLLLASNHLSFLDPFLVLVTIPPRLRSQIFTLGWEPYFRSRLAAWVARVGHVIRIGPTTPLTTILRAAAALVQGGKAVLIFPEGERSIDGRLLPFKKGISVLACELGAPVIPIRIVGSYEAWPPHAARPRPHPITIYFGAPITVTPAMLAEWAQQGRDPHEAASNLIRDAVERLAEQSSK